MNSRFPSRLRLRTKADYSALRDGKRLDVGPLRLVFLPNHRNHARLGLAVSRKFGSAVLRNRFKRQIRECFRLHPVRKKGVDILVIPLRDGRRAHHVAEAIRRGLDVLAMTLGEL